MKRFLLAVGIAITAFAVLCALMVILVFLPTWGAAAIAIGGWSYLAWGLAGDLLRGHG